MTYTVLAFSSVAIALILEWTVIRSGIFKTISFYFAYAIVVGFQLLTNGYLTFNNIVQYNPDGILGIRVAYAPIEDLFFGFTLVMLTMAFWVKTNNGKPRK